MSDKNQFQSDWERISNLVGGLTEQQVRQALTEIVSQDKKLESWLELKYSKGITEIHMDKIKEDVEQCYGVLCQKMQLNGDNDLGDFLDSLKKILNEKVQILIDKGSYLEAFEMTLYIMKSAGTAVGVDKNGSIYALTNTCLALWQNILWDCDEEQKKLIHRWLKSSKEKGFNEYFFAYEMQSIVDEILASEFNDEDIIKRQLDSVDMTIQKILNEDGEEGLAYYKGYPHPIIERINLMETLKVPEDEINQFKDEFIFVPEVRLMETKRTIANGDYEKALRMIKVSKDVDGGRTEWEKIYSDLLISIYSMTNNINAYRNELINNLRFFEQDTTYNVERLKNSVEFSEWPEWREKIYHVMKSSRGRWDFLFEEGMHRELLDELQNGHDVWAMERYVDELAKEFPMEVISYYIDELHNEMEVMVTRQDYKDMIKKLRKIAELPGGKLVVDGLVAEWRNNFPERIEMMEELKTAGF